jgi:hypothetical protein
VAQALLDGGQHLAVTPGLGVDDPIRMQAHPGESGRKQITPAQALEHRARQSRQDAAREKSRQRGVLGRGPGFRDLVHGPEQEAAGGQMAVDHRDTEGQRSVASSPT